MKIKSKIFIGIVTMVVFFSCYGREEGCLDLLSDNYDVFADDECTECCTFPKMIFAVSAINGLDTTYSISDTITTLSGDSIRILEAKFYISNISVFANAIQTNSNTSIIDSLSNSSYSDDIVFLRPQDKVINVGQFKFAGKADSITCHLGLNNDLINGVFNAASNTNPLNRRNKLTDENGNSVYGFMKCQSFNKGLKDTLDVYITKPIFQKLKWQDVTRTSPGKSISLKMVADYKKLVEKIKKNMTAEEAENVISENLTRFLSVK